MPTILHIESATLTCSVAVSRNGETLALKETHDQTYSHSEKLVVFIDETIKKAGLKPSDLDAVCVSKGPGSYTGLRIGVSAAKGLCYGLGIPLLSVGSLESMTHWAMTEFSEQLTDISFFCPMIDARRMEVYTQMFDASLKELQPVSAEIIDEASFAEELEKGNVAFLGDGAGKCKEFINHPNAIFLDDFNPSARGMIGLAEGKFAAKQFEDVAYFEPYYLKDFVAGKPKRVF
ncbi:MAG: tRNA (adenosine(37)-N6)-threonylcarbamoyltransferase complex dimerization subunit type 1 TsaB [Flavobacteriales bacterium]|nr:tRNA (adenosine(37)-N6)-threonylcarbamoyltransferase complex dimerization subunit type 1 TsaB [Flavobacteriales bacterium]